MDNKMTHFTLRMDRLSLQKFRYIAEWGGAVPPTRRWNGISNGVLRNLRPKTGLLTNRTCRTSRGDWNGSAEQLRESLAELPASTGAGNEWQFWFFADGMYVGKNTSQPASVRA